MSDLLGIEERIKKLEHLFGIDTIKEEDFVLLLDFYQKNFSYINTFLE